ncbi:MAG: T9SS type A sorting domain-containing protein [Chitinophagaceae bacterium]|nr:T9SS type A sorting domain-containing protein [Chitinophagaceae bacterium]
MKPLVLFSLLIIMSFRLQAADYYWVGGSGSWSDLSHWAAVSGGPANKSIVPGPGDDVYFDANSGLISSSIVTLPVSAAAYCRNLSWAGVNVNARFQGTSSSVLNVYGNIALSGAVRYGMGTVVFLGNSNATYTVNGAINTSGLDNSFTVDKAGGILKVMDNIPSGLQVRTITLSNGNLDLSGRTHSFINFSSANTNTRSLDISNATLTSTGTWDFRLANKSLTATGTWLTANWLLADGGTYDKVDITRVAGDEVIGLTTFGALTFTNPTALPGTARIGGSNVIRRLEFKGNGNISVGGNTIDTLIIAPGKSLRVVDNQTVNKLLQLNTPDCSGLGQLNGYLNTGSITFGPDAETDLRNVYIEGMTATGTLPGTIVGVDGGNNTGWTFTAPTSGNPLYWVGGAGNWNDKDHWSLTSGGAGGACVPLQGDNVVFDANSGFTSGNNIVTVNTGAWCHDMTWTNVTGSPVFNNTGYTLYVWGSLALNAGLTMNGNIAFDGAEASTLTANGYNLGSLSMNIRKTGANGGITLADDLNATLLSLSLASGKFLMPNRILHIRQFDSRVTTTRTLDISSSTITVDLGWQLYGSGCSSVNNAAGSFITSNGGFICNFFNFPKVHCTGAGNSFDISNSTFTELTFTNPVPAVQFRALSGNNTITTLDLRGSAELFGSNSITNLFLAPSKTYNFRAIQTVNGLFRFNTPDCSALGQMRGLDGGATIKFGPSSSKDINNVLVQNINATGSGTPVIVNGADAGGNAGFTFTAPASGARYWVGGSGDWNDPAHWSATSGGAGGACVPSVNNDVYFDAASFTSGSSTVTINQGNAFCRNMDWTGAAFNPVFSKDGSLVAEVWGDLVLNPTMTINAYLNFTGGASTSITFNGFTNNSGDFDIILLKPTGSTVTFTDDYINSSRTTEIELRSGGLDMRGRTVTVQWLTDISFPSSHSLNITNTIFNGGWHYEGVAQTLQAAGSVINANIFRSNAGTYNVVNVSAVDAGLINIRTTTIDSLVFTDPSGTSQALIANGNNINYLEFKGKGLVNGTGNTFGDLVFYPGKQYSFLSGSNNTITGNWYGSGSPCNLTEVTSTSTSNAIVTKTTGSSSFDYVRLRGITAAGSLPFIAKEHSVDLGNNVNWQIEPYDGNSPILGLGADTAIRLADFPYTLRTDGFFSSPLSQYLWNDGSTLDNLVITAPGTYSVNVSFADGCSISDAITITEASALPVTLNGFTATLQNNCSAIKLNWFTLSEQSSRDFIIQRSSDGRSWKDIRTVTAAGNSYQTIGYSYTDATVSGEVVYYYRLQMNDIDGKQKQSAILTVRLNCGSNQYLVYPNPVKDVMTIQTPSGNGQKTLSVYNGNGQRIANYLLRSGSAQTITTSTWKQGVYLVVVTEMNKQVHTEKVIKQ